MQFRHKKLQSYTYLEDLGKGGQGKVVKVHDTTGKRVYALKILKDIDDLYLLKREAMILEKLNHSNIVQVYETSFEGEDEHFILMQYMNHGDINSYIEKNQHVNLFQRLLLIQDTASALLYAHNKGILHRDIKPSNIFISDDGRGAYACLGDFGIAKDNMADTSSQTASGLQSMWYLPIEVLNGKREKNGLVDDVYALGMSMYEVITGRHAYDTSSPGGFFNSIHLGITPPSNFTSDVPEIVDRLCLKAIALNEEERYSSLENFIQDLDECVEVIKTKKRKEEKVKKGVNSAYNTHNQLLKEKFETISKIMYPHVFLKILDKEQSTVIPMVGYEKEVLGNLKEFTKSHEVSLKEKILLIHDVALGIKQYHNNKIIHGHINFENIMVMGNTSSLDEVRTKNDDIFPCYAALCTLPGLYGENATAEKGEQNKNFYFMAPEVIDKGKGMNEFSDMYALGMTLFQMLTECLPFDIENISSFYHYVESDETLQLQEYCNDIPKDINELCVKMMHKNLEKRFKNINELLGAIQKLGVMQNKDYLLQNKYRAFYGFSKEQNKYVGALKSIGKWFGNHKKEQKGFFLVNEDQIIVTKNPKRYEHALEGDTKSIVEIASLYEKGTEEVKVNYDHAMRWYLYGLEKGNSDMWYHLGKFFEIYSEVLNEEKKSALLCYEKGTQANDKNCMWNLGRFYAVGQGVKRDLKKAKEWYEQAATRGHVKSMIELGDICVSENRKEQMKIAKIWYMKAAKQGDNDAMKKLARMFRGDYQLDSSNADLISSKKWFECAVKKGDPEAMYELGKMYHDPKYHLGRHNMSLIEYGKNKYEVALKWYTQAAEEGYIKAMYQIGRMYLYGCQKIETIGLYNYNDPFDFSECTQIDKFDQDVEQGIEWILKAAEAKDTDAMIEIADIYFYGKFQINKNFNEAKVWYERAAAKNNAYGMKQLGVMYERVEKNYCEAYERYYQAAERGSQKAKVKVESLAVWHGSKNKNFEKIHVWCKKELKKNNSIAMLHLGILCDIGVIESEGREEEAVKWYKKAIIQSDKEAKDTKKKKEGEEEKLLFFDESSDEELLDFSEENNVAEPILGNSEEENVKRILEWYEKTDINEIGYRFALYRLGHCYKMGIAVEQNIKQANTYYARAGIEGSGEALNELGNIFSNGIYVTKNYAEAVKLYEKAIVMGSKNAAHNLAMLYENGGYGIQKEQLKAIELYLQSAKIGNINSVNRIGNIYMMGEGITKDYKKAQGNFEYAAKRNNIEAMKNLGLLHEIIMDKNSEQKAIEWYQKASECGDKEALERLASIFAYGTREVQNYTKAIQILKLRQQKRRDY